jgi:D-ribose pyranase
VLRAVLSELQVQSTVIATEALVGEHHAPPAWYSAQMDLTPSTVSHEEFKKICSTARAMVRTGECTPYANIILVAGVTF